MTKFRIAILTAASILSLSCMNAVAHADNFGAIAYSPESGSVGWSYDAGSRRDAERMAMNNCENYADDCRVAIYFYNACGAVARAPDGSWGSGWGSSRRRAESEALDSCSNHGDGCRVIRWACTSR